MTTIEKTSTNAYASAVKDPVERIVRYLLQYPYDLVRASRTMRRLRVSAGEFQQALDYLDHYYSVTEN